MSIDVDERVAALSAAGVDRIDADTLAGLPAVARIAFRALAQLEFGSLRLTTPDGRVFRFQGRRPGPDADLRLANWRLPGRALRSGSVGLAESYMDGDWDSSDITTFLTLFTLNGDVADRNFALGGVHALIARLLHWFNRNTRAGSRRNIAAHYDLGNAFYEQWLDATMTYSSALFGGRDATLEDAQIAKYRALADGLDLRPGQHVLEIGCGWGGFAEYAAREHGVRVTGLTLSAEQLAFARERIAKAGLSGLVELRLQDYRDERGTYDRIASIEMFEAVGEAYWPSYFATLRDRLVAGGRAGLQIITIAEDRFENYRSQPDFIQRYIFPGGMLPTLTALRALLSEHGLKETGGFAFAADYARTLASWRERFAKSWPTIAPLGFDERFRRMWSLYLHYCEAGFLTRNTDVHQLFAVRS